MRGPRSLLLGLVLAGLTSGPLAHAAAGAAGVEAARQELQGALLEAVGTLSGAGAYSAFMAVGALADGWVREVYPAEQVLRIAAVLGRLARAAAIDLDELIGSGGLHEEDRAYAQGMVDAYRHLEAEAEGLSMWVQTGDRAAFDAARDLAWKTILATLAVPAEEALE